MPGLRTPPPWLACFLLLAACSGGAAPGSTVTSTTATTSTLTSTTVATSTSTTTTTTEPATTSTETAPTEPTTTTTEPVPPARVATAEDPLRVWVIGDSLAGPVGVAIRSDGGATGVVHTQVDSVDGSGLVRPAFFDWPARVAEGLPRVHPEAVVVLIGANDAQPIDTPGGRLEPGTPEWLEAYTVLVADFMDLLTGHATRVYWVGLPPMAGPHYTEQMQVLNRIFREQAEQRPAVAYLDAFTLFSDEEGRYAASLPDEEGNLVEVRLPDGIHYSAAGARRLSPMVLGAIAADWGFTHLLGK